MRQGLNWVSSEYLAMFASIESKLKDRVCLLEFRIIVIKKDLRTSALQNLRNKYSEEDW